MANVAAVIGLAGETSVEDLWHHLLSGPPTAASPGRLLPDAAAQAIADAGHADRLDADRLGTFTPGAGEGDALAAVERACQSLESGEHDLALVGAGASVAVLKRLPQALADGDRILAVIHGPALLPAPAPVPRAGESTAGEPAAARERPALANPYAPPANPLEAAIASVWQEELGLDRVGVDDNFFELGGTSIAGVKIIALLKDWLHQDVPTVSLYEGPTVRALAGVLLHSGPARGYDAVRERGERRRRKLQRLGQKGARQEPTEEGSEP